MMAENRLFKRMDKLYKFIHALFFIYLLLNYLLGPHGVSATKSLLLFFLLLLKYTDPYGLLTVKANVCASLKSMKKDHTEFFGLTLTTYFVKPEVVKLRMASWVRDTFTISVYVPSMLYWWLTPVICTFLLFPASVFPAKVKWLDIKVMQMINNNFFISFLIKLNSNFLLCTLIVEKYAQKKRGTFSIFSTRGVWRNLDWQNNQKPAPYSASIFAISVSVIQSPNFRVDRIQLKRFSNISKCAYPNYTRCSIGKRDLFLYKNSEIFTLCSLSIFFFPLCVTKFPFSFRNPLKFRTFDEN